LEITDTSDDDTCENKLRRTQQDQTQITTDLLPFIDFTFVDAKGTNNFLVNKGLLEVNIYSPTRGIASSIYSAIDDILKDNYEDMIIVAEGQVNSAITGCYCYRVRYKPLVNS